MRVLGWLSTAFAQQPPRSRCRRRQLASTDISMTHEVSHMTEVHCRQESKTAVQSNWPQMIVWHNEAAGCLQLL
jgi:hypothetical protein